MVEVSDNGHGEAPGLDFNLERPENLPPPPADAQPDPIPPQIPEAATSDDDETHLPAYDDDEVQDDHHDLFAGTNLMMVTLM